MSALTAPEPYRGLWRYGGEKREGKFLVLRRDGSIPEWPSFVIGAGDPAAPAALLAYADQAEKLGMHADYVRDLRRLAVEFNEWRWANRPGDPDAPPHRKDDPKTIARMIPGRTG